MPCPQVEETHHSLCACSTIVFQKLFLEMKILTRRRYRGQTSLIHAHFTTTNGEKSLGRYAAGNSGALNAREQLVMADWAGPTSTVHLQLL